MLFGAGSPSAVRHGSPDAVRRGSPDAVRRGSPDPAEGSRGRSGDLATTEGLQTPSLFGAGLQTPSLSTNVDLRNAWLTWSDIVSSPTAAVYFVTLTVVDWLPIFISQDACRIITESLNFCHNHKGLRVNAYVIMPTHLHAIVFRETFGPDVLKATLTDFSKFTARKLMDHCTRTMPACYDTVFVKSAGMDRNRRFWQPTIHPEQIETEPFWIQKRDYLHDNPCRKGLVARAEHWRFSSAKHWLSDGTSPSDVIRARLSGESRQAKTLCSWCESPDPAESSRGRSGDLATTGGVVRVGKRRQESSVRRRSPDPAESSRGRSGDLATTGGVVRVGKRKQETFGRLRGKVRRPCHNRGSGQSRQAKTGGPSVGSRGRSGRPCHKRGSGQSRQAKTGDLRSACVARSGDLATTGALFGAGLQALFGAGLQTPPTARVSRSGDLATTLGQGWIDRSTLKPADAALAPPRESQSDDDRGRGLGHAHGSGTTIDPFEIPNGICVPSSIVSKLDGEGAIVIESMPLGVAELTV